MLEIYDPSLPGETAIFQLNAEFFDVCREWLSPRGPLTPRTMQAVTTSHFSIIHAHSIKAMALLVSLALGCGETVSAGDGAGESFDADDDLAVLAPVAEDAASCTVSAALDGDTFWYAYDNHVGTTLTMSLGVAGMAGEMKHDGIVAASFQITATQGTTSSHVVYAGGPTVDLQIGDDGWVTGTVAGKPIQPFSSKNIGGDFVLKEQGGAPIAVPDGDAELRGILAEILAEDSPCGVQGTAKSMSPHASQPSGSFAGCSDCRANCETAVAACVFTAAGVCAVFAAIPIVGVAIAGGCALIGFGVCAGVFRPACIDACSIPPAACCPVGCTNGTCCAAGEHCVAGAELCCASGFTPCPGPNASCRTNQETCMPDGVACPTDKVCGDVCCGDTEDCDPNTLICLSQFCSFPGGRFCNETCCDGGQAEFCFDLENSECRQGNPFFCNIQGLQWCAGIGGEMCCSTCAYHPDGTPFCA